MARHLRVAAAVLATVWGSAAVWVDGPTSRPLAAGLALGFVALAAVLLFAIRPRWRGELAWSGLFAVVLVWWLGIEASNDRDWLPDVARSPRAVVEGDIVTISNLRNFEYRTEHDFSERWEERSYDLRELRGVDMFLSYWGSPMIAHTIASWDFGPGRHLAISIETRKERGEAYSAVLGFFRQYELHYVVADERDVVGVRTNHRGEDVFLYRLTTSPETARAILVDYLEEANSIADHPSWYNALTHNCTTTIRRHVQHVAPGNPWSWKILVNGYIDELGYERGQIDTSLPFEELRARSNITEAARSAAGDLRFSERIRESLPQRQHGKRGPPRRATL